MLSLHSLSESFSEQTEHQEQESSSKEEETGSLSCAVPSTQVTYQQQHSLGAHNSLLPTEEENASDQTHVHQIIDKDINEANLIPDKRDFRGKIILKEYLYNFSSFSPFMFF